MIDFTRLYEDVYRLGNLFGIEKRLEVDPLTHTPGARKNSVAVQGGAFGDEGKGKIVDELCHDLAHKYGKVVVYRWNGGANAGHTITVGGKRMALHQLPSGTFTPGATVILGKGMVIHPGDLLVEMALVAEVSETPVLIDEMAVLSLDTHRALEDVLKRSESGGRGATGRGVSPAYADILLRHPVRARDLKAADWRERLGKHYDLYAGLVGGLDRDLATARVPTLQGSTQEVGTRAVFLERLAAQRADVLPYFQDVYPALQEMWNNTEIPFIFEGAQAVGLDIRYGVYPDVTASDPTVGGILASTEGVIHPDQIAVKASAIKATYTSSVGTRRLPTMMDEALAHRIREDAHEYGATTRRPRDIVCIDLPCLEFFTRASGATHLALTHLDIAYPDTPIKVCTHYVDSGGAVAPYRPDQEHLNRVTARYVELPSWDGAAIQGITEIDALPLEAKQYVAFLSKALNATLLMGTTGPQRNAIISWTP